ncbi:ORF6N domain-containing protein [Pseudovibrio exalbescens]|uniref:ORF6N domain-containing protein n=1 Tax=Pseudovibrio exalbescens TaxID=197461 RepID=UPI00236718AC|nr:ORF6N domain-containing protein [Pseudovibrio exalbescens]MDD7910454.1 ORF6N domain-containing protein [Pseudovibrio exalbescens]
MSTEITQETPELDEELLDGPRVFKLRGQHVMLAAHVARVFEVETRQITQNIKNNLEKFPEAYAFEVSPEELDALRSLGVISKPGRGGSRALPWVVSQKGAIRLSTIMDSPKAIEAADVFIDVFTEVLRQVYAGKDQLEISKPSRLKPSSELQERIEKIRTQLFSAINDLLETKVDSQNKITVKDELGQVADGIRKHYHEWLKSKRVSNDKIEAETLLLLEKVQDLRERRAAHLSGAALSRESQALENMKQKIAIIKDLMDLHDKLEPNAVVQMVGDYSALALTDATEKILEKPKG